MPQREDRMAPADVEAEESVLGSLLIDPEAINDVMPQEADHGEAGGAAAVRPSWLTWL